MPLATCPDCMQEGRVPESFLGRRIKCSKCGNRFLVTGASDNPAAPGSKAIPAGAVNDGSSALSPSTPTFEGIVVEGFEGGWSDLQDDAALEVPARPLKEPETSGVGQVTGATGAPPPEGVKEYKLLTPKDKIFDNKFDLPRLEEVINTFALKGWTVRSMTTAQVAGFSGGVREELIVLLER